MAHNNDLSNEEKKDLVAKKTITFYNMLSNCARCGEPLTENYGWVDIDEERYRICNECKKKWRRVLRWELKEFVRANRELSKKKFCTNCGCDLSKADIRDTHYRGVACLCTPCIEQYGKHIDKFAPDFINNKNAIQFWYMHIEK